MDFKNEMFGARTTYGHDYLIPKLEDKRPFNQYKPRKKYPEKSLHTKPYRPKDTHTLQYWTDPKTKVPFDLLWQAKDITRTSPYAQFAQCTKPEDLEKEEVMKTRPRLYTSPAVSMDDIADPEVRDMLCKNMYLSTWKKAIQDSNLKIAQRQIPNAVFEKSANPLKEDYSIYKPIGSEWKKKGRSWETHQYATLTDTSANFWKKYEHRFNTPIGVDPHTNLINQEERNEIRKLVDKDELRDPFGKVAPNLPGYVPRNVIGPLSRKELGSKD